MAELSVNRIVSFLQRPERGWDPVPPEYVERHGAAEWALLKTTAVDQIEAKIGPLKGRTVLDLGGGPGQYTLELARRGAQVTWYDISAGYKRYVQARQAEAEKAAGPLEIEYLIGYLDDAARSGRQYDFVFNRICWCYSMDDFRFGRVIYDLLKPGGHAYLMVNYAGDNAFAPRSRGQKARYWLNELTGIKIGHPHPSLNRIRQAVVAQPFSRIELETSSDNVYFWLTR